MNMKKQINFLLSYMKKKDAVEFALDEAISCCGVKGEKNILLEQGTYHFDYTNASECFCNIANHGFPEVKKVAFNLHGIENITIDGNGSRLVIDDVMIPFAIQHCKNVTIKNFEIESKYTFQLQGRIVETNDDFCIIRADKNQDYYIDDAKLYVGNKNKNSALCFNIIEMNNDMTFQNRGSDYIIDLNRDIKFYQLDNDNIKICGMGFMPKVDNIIVFMTRCRYAANIFIHRSSNILLENITLYSGIGMGLIAQLTENITVDKMKTCCHNGMFYSINADATHFVHCKGLVWVKNCNFKYQLDDAMNVHGVYTCITDKTKDYITVKFMHHQTKGLDIYNQGDLIQISKKRSLIPYLKLKINRVEIIDIEYVKLYLEGDMEAIEIGDFVENISWKPNVILENTRIDDNRARGILIGHGKKIIVRNNYFHSHGTAILLEGNEYSWYEAGAVENLHITKNIFDKCKYTKNGNAVIEMTPRIEYVKDKYYHKNIRIIDNKFIDCGAKLLLADSVDGITFLKNKVLGCSKDIDFRNCLNVFND